MATEQAALRTTKGVANELVAEALAGSDMLMPLIEVRTMSLRTTGSPESLKELGGKSRLVWQNLAVSRKPCKRD